MLSKFGYMFLSKYNYGTALLTGLGIGIIFLVSCCKPIQEKDTGKVVEIDSIPLTSELIIADSFFSKAKYDSALIYYEKAALQSEQEKNWDNLINTILKITDLQRQKGISDEAIETMERAHQIAQKYTITNKHLHSDIFRKKGLLYLDIGNFDSAISLISTSIELKIKSFGAQDTSLSLNYNGLGTVYFYIGDYAKALENYTIAYNLALKRKNAEDADLAMYLQNIGIINAQKGDYDKAEEAFTTALGINEKLLKAEDPELAMIHLNVGRLKALLNKDLEALDYYNKAEDILIIKTDTKHPYYISLYLNKGQTYVHMADYEKALIYFNKALALANVSLEKNHPQILLLNMNIGYVYEKKSDFNNARQHYLASIPDGYENSSLVKTYSNLASLYNSMKDPDKSNEYYTKALKLAEMHWGTNHPETGLLYTRYGFFLIQNPQKEQGLDYFNKALDISLKQFGPKSRGVSHNYFYIGQYHFSKNDFISALEYYQKAIVALVKDFNEMDVKKNPELASIEADRFFINAITGKAYALDGLGGEENLKLSLECFKLSIKVIEKLRSTYQDEESKLLISGEVKSTFQKTVSIAAKLYQITKDQHYLAEAFDYSDKSKSAVLINSMRDIEAQHFGKIPKDILLAERQLKLNLSNFRRFIYEERQKPNPDDEKINGWESRVFEFTVRYDSLVSFLEQEYPDYYNLKYTEPQVSILTIQNSLEADRALIEYMLTDSLLYTFVINKNSFSLYSVEIDSSFYKDIQTLVASTNNNSLLSIKSKNFIDYSKAASNLYNILVKPIREDFDEKKLIIIPDAEIGYISFDMLLTALPDTNKMDFRKLPYLINDKIISYSTSAILQYSGFRKREHTAEKNLLAMAPSYNNLTGTTNTSFVDENGEKVYLLPIPGIEKEMQGIKRTLSGKTITGTTATENKFKDEAGQYTILHLAMHTLINNAQPMLSKLVFYQGNDSIEDGMLNTYELFSMDLNAQLAVLSACNTGTGKLVKGEGIMNLARGFIFAGVPSIVMTMWSVEDQSSADIVMRFYEYLEEGMTKDEALRQSKLDLLAKGDPLRSHPFYWAAYVNIGDYSPMVFKNKTLLYSFLGSSAFILMGLLIFIKLKNKSVKAK